MSAIHQIYCTHCTHGSSALERREGEFAHRMLGYSARAGSVEAAELRRRYRQVERYAYYYLPRDTPAEEKLRLTAATAPQRMVYLPDIGGVQIVGQVSYRATDTEGRPGSYFAHILFRDGQDGPAWSPLDCLRLWNAKGWTREDTPSIPFLLRPLATLDELLQDVPPALDDALLLDFLTAPAGAAWHDPQGVVPERWRQMEVAARQSHFAAALAGLLDALGRERGALLLAVEPSVAALWFYGLLRLLPPAWRERLSYSTFEPNPDRVCTTLAATWFYDPARAELRADTFRSRGVCISTLEQHGPPAPATSAYARLAVERLLTAGFGGVEQTLANFQAAGAQTVPELEALAEVDAIAGTFLAGGPLPAGDHWRRSPMATHYFRRKVVQDLSAVADPTAVLQPLVGRPQQLILVELLSGPAETPAVARAQQFLLDHITAPQIAGLLTTSAAGEAKAAVLARHLASAAALPPGCEALLDEPADSGLLSQALARLPAEAAEDWYRKLAPEAREVNLPFLTAAYRLAGPAWPALTHVVATLDEAALLQLHRRFGDEFFQRYPDDEPALGRKLHDVLRTLPDAPEAFAARLGLVLANERLLPDDHDLDAAVGWRRCHQAILEVGQLQKQTSAGLGLRSLRPLEDACQQMIEGLARALPPDSFADDRHGSERLARLRAIGRALLGEELLPSGLWQHDALWQKAAQFFELHRWPTASLRRVAGKPSVRPATLWGTVSAVAVVLLLAFGLWMFTSGNDKAKVAQRGTGNESSPLSNTGNMGGRNGPATPENRAVPSPSPPPAKPPKEHPIAVPPDVAKPPDATALPAEPPAEPKTTEPPPVEPPPMDAEQERRQREAEAQRLADEQTKKALADLRADLARQAKEHSQRADETRTRWLAAVQQFAKSHRGAVIVDEPLHDGWTTLAPQALPPSAGAMHVYLGGGSVRIDEKQYDFGGGFESAPATTRQEIPRMAADFGFAAVYVGVQARSDGIYLLVTATPQTAPAEAAGPLRDELKRLESRQNRIIARLADWKKWDKAPDSDEKKDKQRELRESLIEIAGIKLPGVPPRPNPKDPKFVADPNALKAANGQYEARVRERDRAVENVPTAAREQLPALKVQIDQLAGQLKQQQARAREENDRALRQWKARCRSITAVLYQDATAGAAEPALPDLPHGEPVPPSQPPPSPDHAPPPTPKTVADPPPADNEGGPARAVGGELKVEISEAAMRPDSKAQAEMRLLVPASQLPRWFRDGYLVNALVREHPPEGAARTTRIDDVFQRKDYRILAAAARIEVCFEFYRRAEGTPGAEPTKVGATTWQDLGVVKPGSVYRVQLELSKQGLERFHESPGTPQ